MTTRGLFSSKGEQMAKGKTTVYFCQNCGYESAKWMGQCPACREWNTFVEETVSKKSQSSSGKTGVRTQAEPVPISAVTAADEERTSTDFTELDRVLGG
jgi:DNA repair protein RadA/Sms